MTLALEDLPMTPEEFLAWERAQDQKHEYHHGEVFAMAGGRPRHAFLSAAVSGELRGALRGRGCQTLSSDMRVGAEGGQRLVYPDVVVVCGPYALLEGTTDVLMNPSMLVEVLSPSTARYDREGKWQLYQSIPSLTDYLLVAQSQVHVEHYQREADGWRYRVFREGAAVTLSNGARLSVDAIYDGAFDVPGDEPKRGPG